VHMCGSGGVADGHVCRGRAAAYTRTSGHVLSVRALGVGAPVS
jgi:hypothetical protein